MTSPSETTALDSAWSEDEIYVEEELHGRPPRAKLGRWPLLLAGVLLATGGFYAGVRVEKSKAKSSSGSSALAAVAARFRNGAGGAAGAGGGAGGAGGAGSGGGALVGTITLIDGQNIYVTDSSGNVVKVITTPSSQFSITSSGTVQQLHPGDTVVVTGPADANGNVTASNVRDGGAGFGGGGRTRGAGGGAGGAGGAGTGGGVGGAGAGGGAPGD